MPSTLLAIALIHWVVLITPGVNVILISTLAADQSRKIAIYAALGVTAVAGIWALMAAMGISIFFSAHPLLRDALKIGGAAYLLLLAARLWKTPHAEKSMTTARLDGLSAFRMGFLTNLMNPKSALFFGSLFATALPPHPSAAFIALVVGIVVLNAWVWHLFLAFAFSHDRVRASYGKHKLLFSRVASGFVGLFGLNMIRSVFSDYSGRS
jgi:threonine efflux protein